jgi:hypothetical protein
MSVGPMAPAEPGTYGIIGGPGKTWLFWAAVPGVIVYTEQRKKQEQEAEAPEKAKEPELTSEERKSAARKFYDELNIGPIGWVIVGMAIAAGLMVAASRGGAPMQTQPGMFPGILPSESSDTRS